MCSSDGTSCFEAHTSGQCVPVSSKKIMRVAFRPTWSSGYVVLSYACTCTSGVPWFDVHSCWAAAAMNIE